MPSSVLHFKIFEDRRFEDNPQFYINKCCPQFYIIKLDQVTVCDLIKRTSQIY